MTRANERILNRKEEETAKLAEATFRALGDVLSTSKHALPVEYLFQMHAGNKARLLELFQKSSGLCGAVRFVFDRWTSMVSWPDDMKDTTLLSDQANLFSSLLAEYPSAFPGEQAESVRQELRKLIHEAVRLCVASVSPQADRLKDVIQGVVEYPRHPLKVFQSHIGWGPNQLERFLENDPWRILSATAEHVFHIGPNLWEEVLKLSLAENLPPLGGFPC